MAWQGMFAPEGREIDPEREEERRLAAQARGGSDWALSALVARYQPTVVRYLIRLTGMPDRAAPVAERIFVRMGKRLRGPHGGDHLRLWLLRAATEAGLDVLRHPNRPAPPRLSGPDGPVGLLAERAGDNGVGRMVSGWAGRLRGGATRKAPPTQEFAWDDQPSKGRVASWTGVADEALSPRETMRNRLVRAVLAELAYGDAQCLALHLVAGLNQNEVGLALGVTPNIARRRIVQGLRLFGERFEAAQATLGVTLDQPGAAPPVAPRPRPAFDPAWQAGFGVAASDTVPARPPAASIPLPNIAAASMPPAPPAAQRATAPFAPAAFAPAEMPGDLEHLAVVPVPAWTAPTMPLPGLSSPAPGSTAAVESAEVTLDGITANDIVDASVMDARAEPEHAAVDAVSASATVDPTGDVAQDLDAPTAATGHDDEFSRANADLAEADIVERAVAEPDPAGPGIAEPGIAEPRVATVTPDARADDLVWPLPDLADEPALGARALVDPNLIVDADADAAAMPATCLVPPCPAAAGSPPRPEAPRLPLAIVIAEFEAPHPPGSASDLGLLLEPVTLIVDTVPDIRGAEKAVPGVPADRPAAPDLASGMPASEQHAGQSTSPLDTEPTAARAEEHLGALASGASSSTFSSDRGDDAAGPDPDADDIVLLLESDPDDPPTALAAHTPSPAAADDLPLAWVDDHVEPTTGEMDTETEPRAEG